MNENEKNKETNPEADSVSETSTSPAQEKEATTDTTTTDSVETTAPVEESTSEASIEAETTSDVADKNPRKKKFMVAAFVIVAVIFLGIFYSMEKNGQSNTGVFGGVERFLNSQKTVATVNGDEITGQDLAISIEQITAGARAQGVDVADAQVQQDIQDQALEVLVNTELLKQEAENRGIEISEEEVTARYDSLVEEVGGEDVLEERMAEFGIDEKTLMNDIQTELTIQTLLDEIFAEEDVAVTDEEINELYESLGGEEAGFPPLEDLRDQLVAQVQAGKEQEVITNYIELLRTNAEIEVTN